MQRYVFLMNFTLQITLFESTNLGLDNINMFFFIFEGFGICEKEQHRAKTKKYPWNALHGWI